MFVDKVKFLVVGDTGSMVVVFFSVVCGNVDVGSADGV